ncbi:MAG: hypothetical protein LV481_10955 [Methylacidiphilales bacterium]|nr:hypothetical protein [Candidatus Methylacidiphilales bacterium]
MQPISFSRTPWGVCRGVILAGMLLSPALLHATSAVPINAEDVNGHSVAVNGKGHYTVVMYTNPDLEDESRAVTLALDPYRSRSDFALVRVVDLRGDVPLDMRGIVRVQIRKEQAKEATRLKKAGVDVSSSNQAPIIPDFSGSTLNALGWNSVYDQVHVVVYDPSGHEIKRMEKVSSGAQVTKVVDSIL